MTDPSSEAALACMEALALALVEAGALDRGELVEALLDAEEAERVLARETGAPHHDAAADLIAHVAQQVDKAGPPG